jgi:serine/threonine-protein kinase
MATPGVPESAERGGANPSQSEGIEGRLIGGRYRLLRQIGTGGMGTVHLCEHVTLGRRFAIKVLHADRCADPELVERFRQEARAASRIDQENVIDVLDFGEDPGGEFYYVMEALDGRSLAQVILEEAPLAVGRALALLEQVCRALAAAHARGIVHRDVKPENVLVERLPGGGERAKVIDFGISFVPGADRLTRDGEIIGTPEYMAPEQATGTAVDALTDVYAAGVLAFELLTGTLPLMGSSAIATLVAHQTQLPPPPSLKRPGLPSEVDDLVLRALAKRPADRFPSMQAMAAEVIRVRVKLSMDEGDPRWGGRDGEGLRTTLSLEDFSAVGAAPPRRPLRLAGALAAGAIALLLAAVASVKLTAKRDAMPAPLSPALARVVAPPEEHRPAVPPEPIVAETAVAPPPRRERKTPPAATAARDHDERDPYSREADPVKPDPFR